MRRSILRSARRMRAAYVEADRGRAGQQHQDIGPDEFVLGRHELLSDRVAPGMWRSYSRVVNSCLSGTNSDARDLDDLSDRGLSVRVSAS